MGIISSRCLKDAKYVQSESEEEDESDMSSMMSSEKRQRRRRSIERKSDKRIKVNSKKRQFWSSRVTWSIFFG